MPELPFHWSCYSLLWGKNHMWTMQPVKQFDLKVLIHSLYNLVAEKLVFRCINYYQGCKELLNFNEAVGHEKTCKKKGFKCPFCEYKGNGCQLVQHFDKRHQECVVEEDTFKIVFKETCSRNLIFVKENNIFCFMFTIRDNFIEFLNLFVSPAHLGPKQYKLRFLKSDTNIEFVTPIQIIHELGHFPLSSFLARDIGCNMKQNEIENSFVLDQTSLLECFPSGWCLCKIELIEHTNYTEEKILNYLEKIKKKVGSKLPTNVVETEVVRNEDNTGKKDTLSMDTFAKLRCSYCEKYLSVPPIYSSEDANICGRCTSLGRRNHLFEQIVKDMIFPCEKCNGQFKFGSPVQRHEMECPYRIIPCVFRNCTEEGAANTMELHFHDHKIQKFKKSLLQVEISGAELQRLFETSYSKRFLLTNHGTTFVAFIYGTKTGSTIHDRVQIRFAVGIFYLQKDVNVDNCDVRFLVMYDDGRATTEIFWQGDIPPFNTTKLLYQNDIIDACIVPSINTNSVVLSLQVYYKNELNTLRCLSCDNIRSPDCETSK